MTTLIICSKTQCMYAKKRKDDLYQCKCTTIGINNKNECDSYMVFPDQSKRCTCSRCTGGVNIEDYYKEE